MNRRGAGGVTEEAEECRWSKASDERFPYLECLQGLDQPRELVKIDGAR